MPGLPSGTALRNTASIQFEVFDTLLKLSKERELIMLLVGLEERAVEGGKLSEYVKLIDQALARIDHSRARHVLMAKARSLGTIPDYSPKKTEG